MNVRKVVLLSAGFVVGTLLPAALVSALLAHHARPLAMTAPSEVTGNNPAGRWRVTHVLVSTCPCSRSLADHLARRGSIDGADERVLVVGNPSAGQRFVDQLGPRGFAVSIVDAQTLKSQFGISGGPWLVVHAPAGQLRYAGGYAARRPAPDVGDDAYQDVRIVSTLRAGTPDLSIEPLVALGCSVDLSLGDLFAPTAR